MMDNFIDLDYLGTMAGVILVVTLLTQFTKELIDIKFKKVPTKYVTFFYALVTILVYQLVKGQFEIKLLYITIINAIIVTLTAQGGYEWIFKKGVPPTLKENPSSSREPGMENPYYKEDDTK